MLSPTIRQYGVGEWIGFMWLRVGSIGGLV
jgi:hypothetical protein